MADEVAALVMDVAKRCQVSNGPGPSPTDDSSISITASVGQFGTNLKPDVTSIQSALNRLSPATGGPAKPLKVDGASGPFTIKAILDFQKFHRLPTPDGRVDPGRETLAKLNAVLGTVPEAERRRGGIPRRGLPLPPDPALIQALVTLVPQVRFAIGRADFNCSVVDQLIRSDGVHDRNLTRIQREALDIIDGTFSLRKLRNPRPAFDNIQVVFRNMSVALNRAFETDPLAAKALFVNNPDAILDDKALGFTAAGGAFLSSNIRLKDTGLPADRIYICNSVRGQPRIEQVATLIHEMAHFVSGRPFEIVDPVATGGSMLNPQNVRAYSAIPASLKAKSAEHYAFFAIVSARFRNLPGPPVA